MRNLMRNWIKLRFRQAVSTFDTVLCYYEDMVATLVSSPPYWRSLQWYPSSTPYCFWVQFNESSLTVPLLSTKSFMGFHTAPTLKLFFMYVENWNLFLSFRWFRRLSTTRLPPSKILTVTGHSAIDDWISFGYSKTELYVRHRSLNEILNDSEDKSLAYCYQSTV